MHILNYFLALLTSLSLSLALGPADDPGDEVHVAKVSAIIIESLKTIRKETVLLEETLSAWDGSLAHALPIQTQFDKVRSTIRSARDRIDVAPCEPFMGLFALATIRIATKELMKTERKSVDTLVGLRDRFRGVLLDKKVAKSVYQAIEEALWLNDQVVPRLPIVFQDLGRIFGQKIHNTLKDAADAYDPKGELDTKPGFPDRWREPAGHCGW